MNLVPVHTLVPATKLAEVTSQRDELLAALKAVLVYDGYSIGDEASALADAAIAKAEGRTA